MDSKMQETLSRLLEGNLQWEKSVEGGIVLYPSSTEEIQRVLRCATKNQWKVIWSSGANSPTVPPEVIYMDLGKMDHILELDAGARYVVVEPGVTLPQLQSYLATHSPELGFVQIPGNDGATAVVAAVTEMPHDRCTLYGSLTEMMNGLEIVLGDGTVVCIGSRTIAEKWFNIGPLPDLKGLFVNWKGDLGVVSKLSLQLLPVARQSASFLFVLKDPQTLQEVLWESSHLELADYIHVFTCAEPEFLRKSIYVGVRVAAATEREMRFKAQKFSTLFQRRRDVLFKDRYPGQLEPRSKTMDLFPEEDYRELRYIAPMSSIQKIVSELRQSPEIAKMNVVIDCSLVDHGHKVIVRVGWRKDPAALGETAEREITRVCQSNQGIVWGKPLVMTEAGAPANLLSGILKEALDPQAVLLQSVF